MKKFLKQIGGNPRKDGTNSLVGKSVVVGKSQVRVEALLGEGGFACIYKVRDINTGQIFALKHLRLQADAEALVEVQREAKTMAKLRGHPNVLRLLALAFAGPKGAETDGFMLLDYCYMTLIDQMQACSFNLDDATLMEAFTCVCQGVAHMHRQNPPMAHRDLKAENVLKLAEGQWVICDFGSTTTRAKVYETTLEISEEEENIRRTTTPAYRAPEMWDLYTRQLIDTKADIWALGVLLYVLAFGKLPFQGDSKLQILFCKYEMPPTRHDALRALIKSMLIANPAERPDIDEVLQQLDDVRKALSLGPAPGPAVQARASPSSSMGGAAATAVTSQQQQQQQAPLQHRGSSLQTAVADVMDSGYSPLQQGMLNRTQQRSDSGVAPAARRSSAGAGCDVMPSRPPPVPPAAAAAQQQQQQQHFASSNATAPVGGSSAPNRTSGGGAGGADWADFDSIVEQSVMAPMPKPLSMSFPAAPAAPAGDILTSGAVLYPAVRAARADSSSMAQPAPAPLQQQQQQQQQLSRAPSAAASPLATPAASRAASALAPAPAASQLPPPAPAVPAASAAAAAARSSSQAASSPRHSRANSSADADASQPAFKDMVLGELEALKQQMRQLLAHNQGLAGRVRQLDEVVALQRQAIERLQQQQQQQQGGPSAPMLSDSVQLRGSGQAPDELFALQHGASAFRAANSTGSTGQLSGGGDWAESPKQQLSGSPGAASPYARRSPLGQHSSGGYLADSNGAGSSWADFGALAQQQHQHQHQHSGPMRHVSEAGSRLSAGGLPHQQQHRHTRSKSSMESLGITKFDDL